jgi:hypothetical protein
MFAVGQEITWIVDGYISRGGIASTDANETTIVFDGDVTASYETEILEVELNGGALTIHTTEQTDDYMCCTCRTRPAHDHLDECLFCFFGVPA